MPADRLPLPRVVRRDIARTTLYLSKLTKTESAQNARRRYGYSLSVLVDRLLARENELKGGLLNAKLAKP